MIPLSRVPKKGTERCRTYAVDRSTRFEGAVFSFGFVTFGSNVRGAPLSSLCHHRTALGGKMLRRVRPAATALAAAVTLPAAHVPTPTTPHRRFEYWGAWVSVRTQPYCQGDKLPHLNNLTGIGAPSAEGQYLTGSLANTAYTTEMLNDPALELQSVSRQTRWYNGHQRWVVTSATEKDIAMVKDQFEKVMSNAAHKDVMFKVLFGWYPQLKKPLDAEVQTKIVDFYRRMLNNIDDEAAMSAIAKPFMLEMQRDKFISQTYWWRFTEALWTALESMPGQPRSAQRAYHIVLERVTKTALNTLMDHPWSHDEVGSPYMFDICGHRAIHEAGCW